MLLKYQSQGKGANSSSNAKKGVSNTNFAPSPLHNQITSRMLRHLVAPCSTLSAPHAI